MNKQQWKNVSSFLDALINVGVKAFFGNFEKRRILVFEGNYESRVFELRYVRFIPNSFSATMCMPKKLRKMSYNNNNIMINGKAKNKSKQLGHKKHRFLVNESTKKSRIYEKIKNLRKNQESTKKSRIYEKLEKPRKKIGRSLLALSWCLSTHQNSETNGRSGWITPGSSIRHNERWKEEHFEKNEISVEHSGRLRLKCCEIPPPKSGEGLQVSHPLSCTQWACGKSNTPKTSMRIKFLEHNSKNRNKKFL